MVFLLTDVGEYRKLPVDRPVSIGRDTTSDIRPDSKSVSKSHAIITVSQIPNTKKFEAYIEDLNSRNGTFVGNSPLDFEKVTGKTKILFGDYIRFGNSSKFFKYLESIPAHENIPPELILSPTKDEKLDLSNLIADTAIYDSKDDDGSEVSKSNRKLEIADEQELKEGGDQSKARIHQLPERRKANSDSNNDPQNLMISVNYPTSGRSLRHPVTVTIDPVIQNQQSNYNSNNFDYSDDFDVDIDSSRTKYTKPKSKKEEVDYLSSSSPAALGTQDRVRFDESNEYYPRLKDEYGVEMRDVESATKPGPNSGILRNSAEVTVNPSENKLRGNNTKNIQQGPPRNSKIKDRDNNSIPRKDLSEPVQILRSPKVDTSKSRYDNSKVEDSLGRIETLMNLSAVPIVRNEVPLIRRSWPSELVKPSSRLICDFVDILLDQDVGVTIARLETGTIFKRDAIACAMPKPIPESIVSEVIANSLTEEEDSYNSLLNRVVVDINELLRQTLQGSKINSSVETSAEFDHALHGVVEGIIRNCLSSINFIIGSNLVKSMDDTSAEPIGNSLGSLLRNSSEALKRINLFLTGGLLADDSQNLRTEEIYEVVSHCLSGILDRLDACNLAVWEVLQHVNEQTQKHVASNLHDPSEMNKSMLSIELEELRKLKKSLELAPSIERIRQQEAALLEKKMLR